MQAHVCTCECTAAQVKFLTDEQAVLVEDCAKAAAEAAQVQEQLAGQQKEFARLGAELAAAEKHGHELDCSLRAMTAEKVLGLSWTRRCASFCPDRLLSMPQKHRGRARMVGFSAVLINCDALQWYALLFLR